jgi:hypothetical protein
MKYDIKIYIYNYFVQVNKFENAGLKNEMNNNQKE